MLSPLRYQWWEFPWILFLHSISTASASGMGRRPAVKLLSLKSQGAVNDCTPLPEQTGIAQYAGSHLRFAFFFFPSIASLLLSNMSFFSGIEEGPAEDFKLREWQCVSNTNILIKTFLFGKALQAGHTRLPASWSTESAMPWACVLQGPPPATCLPCCASNQLPASPTTPIGAGGKSLIVCSNGSWGSLISMCAPQLNQDCRV